MIMILMIFYTQIYQTFRVVFTPTAHLNRKFLLYISYVLTKHAKPEQNITQFSSEPRDRNPSDSLMCNDPGIAYTVFSNTIEIVLQNDVLLMMW